MTKITFELQKEVEFQIREKRKEIKYDTKDYTVELLTKKFNDKEFFIPPYQRNFVWQKNNRSKFIESVLLGLPIPFMFFAQCEDGRMEIIDGAQRMQTLVSFMKNEFSLTNLEKLTKVNKFKFCNLPKSEQLKFLNITFRVIVLDESTTIDIRQDLFHRINTTSVRANDSEIRRGSFMGALTDFIEKCSQNALFQKLCPLSKNKIDRHERFELILRFFAYTNAYQYFKHDVNKFLDEYLQNNLDNFDESAFEKEFTTMLSFVEKTFPNGFAKLPTSKTTPRVRFEALAIGSALALRIKPDLVVKNIDWITSKEFEEKTTSDASNNTDKLKGRIEYVRNKLLEN